MLLSFVRANCNRSVGFLQDFQRLNVALTRSKHLLVMVGHADTLRNCYTRPPRNGTEGLVDGERVVGNVLATLLDDAARRGRLVKPSQLKLGGPQPIQPPFKNDMKFATNSKLKSSDFRR